MSLLRKDQNIVPKSLAYTAWGIGTSVNNLGVCYKRLYDEELNEEKSILAVCFYRSSEIIYA